MINGNAVGGIVGYGKTFVLTDEIGNELTGVVVDEEVIFTADPVTDIREGKVAATDQGVVTGSKKIPAYHTNAGTQLILPNSNFSIPLSQDNAYNYTALQCMIALADLNDLENSVDTDRIVLNDTVFQVNSTTQLSNVTKNNETLSIDLNLVNNSENYYIIYYFTYREEY